jgi:hypothetical protein
VRHRAGPGADPAWSTSTPVGAVGAGIAVNAISGETFDIDEDDAAQFLANGSAVEAPAKAKRGAAK